LKLVGKHIEGLGVGGKFISMEYYLAHFRKLLGCDPYPGTLNLETHCDWRELQSLCKPYVVPGKEVDGRMLGPVLVWRGVVELKDGERVQCLILRPLLSKHKSTVLELVSCTRLRERLGAGPVRVEVACEQQEWLRLKKGPREADGYCGKSQSDTA
jgi:riboflavin kinase